MGTLRREFAQALTGSPACRPPGAALLLPQLLSQLADALDRLEPSFHPVGVEDAVQMVYLMLDDPGVETVHGHGLHRFLAVEIGQSLKLVVTRQGPGLSRSQRK